LTFQNNTSYTAVSNILTIDKPCSLWNTAHSLQLSSTPNLAVLCLPPIN